MLETLKYLTQIQPPRNFKNINSLNNIASYLENRFKDIGLKTFFQNFIVDKNEYKNVIATLNPQYEKRLIIGAHYDVCGNFQGADDNASAVAGLIQTAKQLYEIKDNLPIRIDFVCFSLEEPPYFGTENMGSHVYAKYLFDNKIDVIGMINYEMIGYFTNENVDLSKLSMFITKKDADISKGNFIAMVCDEQSQDFMNKFNFENVDKKIEYVEAMIPTPINQITASDHLNFWKFGYKAIMVTDTAFFRNPNYHTINDTLETLNLEKMQYVVDLVVESIKKMTKNKDFFN
ncbi:M28 family peptidase [Aliarcobacter cryaerophilus]|uniref:Peptidase M28 n=1 Tax=Aliarcobacter cryaerophilus TaxID=28198 RepID=A0A2S9T5T6_9BACT|nr:M28 family peptidase [Aliarcobacter cryaerophilus]PRM94197.1 peptidase M28 [Arcobacter cryaerophilus gv. crypticus]